MLEQILRHIHNRFEYAYLQGTFEVSGGTFEIDGAADGQYVWIEGSVFSSGLHPYPLSGLRDETFRGRVYLLAVPEAVIDLADRISAWQDANGAVVDSPYQSESFGGYSYSKGSGSSGSDGSSLSGWRAQFRDELNPWRKIGCERW